MKESKKEKKVQVSLPKELYLEAKTKLVSQETTWQDLLKTYIENWVKKGKKG